MWPMSSGALEGRPAGIHQGPPVRQENRDGMRRAPKRGERRTVWFKPSVYCRMRRLAFELEPGRPKPMSEPAATGEMPPSGRATRVGPRS